ncbi:MAG TPA: hypothetical protein VKT51_08195 [Candidatus Eremiobacteraceae bacterium]|nr:hypothetical protein [Candidatus Eremiobacteraceae bacterium]
MISPLLFVLLLADANSDAATNASAGAFAAIAGMGIVGVLIGIGLLILSLWINWTIASKAGYSGALSLLLLIPIVNLIIVLIFAFSEWPVQRELREARTRGA